MSRSHGALTICFQFHTSCKNLNSMKSEEELQNSLMQKLGLLIEGEIIEDNPSPKPTSTLAKTSTAPVIVRETVPLPVLPTINFTDIINLP
jgi:hypothetical protein